MSPHLRPAQTALVLLVAAVLYLPGLGNHDLWNPNEPVFAEGAREMLDRGEWLVPYVNGAVYEDKPILYFWAIMVSSLPGGEVTGGTARFPSAVASILLVWAVVVFGARAFGARAGLLAGLFLAIMPVFVWEARFAQMDPMLSLFTFLSLICFHRARHDRSALWLAVSGAAAGLAVLTKGPVGLVLPGAAALAMLAMDRDMRFLLRPAWAAGLGGFLLVGVPWYLAVWAGGHGDYLYEFFVRQNFARYVDPFDHARPFHYYVTRFLGDLFPWSLFLPLVLLDRPRAERKDAARSAWWLCLLYVALTLLFFSASGAKRGVYILPLYPAYAVLVGRAWDRGLGGVRAGAWRAITGVAGGLLLVAGSAAAVVGGQRFPEQAPIAMVLGGLLALTGAATLVGAVVARRTLIPALSTLSAGIGIALAVAAVWAIPQVDALKSARAFSERVLAHAGTEAPLRSFRFWRWRSEYIFYTRRLMPVLEDGGETNAFLSRPEPVYLLVEESDRPALEQVAEHPLHRLETDAIGGKTMHLYSNRPPSGGLPGR